MPASIESHSHRSTTKIAHKPFKSRKSTKGALKELAKGKISSGILENILLNLLRQDTRP
jgi:hypothetical protein